MVYLSIVREAHRQALFPYASYLKKPLGLIAIDFTVEIGV